MNELVFFLVALAEVQVAFLSVLNLPRQGFLATCRIGHCCVLQPAVICLTGLSDSPTYSKQSMNNLAGG